MIIDVHAASEHPLENQIISLRLFPNQSWFRFCGPHSPPAIRAGPPAVSCQLARTQWTHMWTFVSQSRSIFFWPSNIKEIHNWGTFKGVEGRDIALGMRTSWWMVGADEPPRGNSSSQLLLSLLFHMLSADPRHLLILWSHFLMSLAFPFPLKF